LGRQDTSQELGLARRELIHPIDESLCELIHGGEWIVRGDRGFRLAPQLVHAIEFRTLLGKPEKFHFIISGELETWLGQMGGRLIEKEQNLLARVGSSEYAQIVLIKALRHGGIGSDEAVSCSQVHPAIEDSLGVSAGNRHSRLLSLP
jgi:hypothetical protein